MPAGTASAGGADVGYFKKRKHQRRKVQQHAHKHLAALRSAMADIDVEGRLLQYKDESLDMDGEFGLAALLAVAQRHAIGPLVGRRGVHRAEPREGLQQREPGHR